MEISKQIKKYRTLNNITQRELGALLNVSDKTVSSWETGRTYPDIQIIVKISDILEISLDELLRGDQNMVEKIAKDTKNRKKLTKKVQLLWISIFLLISLSLFFGYKNVEHRNISEAQQIQSVTIKDNDTIVVELNLPFYRSVSSYWMNNTNPDDDNSDDSSVELTLGESIDWTMTNRQTIEVPIDKEIFPKMKRINIIGKSGTIKSIPIK